MATFPTTVDRDEWTADQVAQFQERAAATRNPYEDILTEFDALDAFTARPNPYGQVLQSIEDQERQQREEAEQRRQQEEAARQQEAAQRQQAQEQAAQRQRDLEAFQQRAAQTPNPYEALLSRPRAEDAAAAAEEQGGQAPGTAQEIARISQESPVLRQPWSRPVSLGPLRLPAVPTSPPSAYQQAENARMEQDYQERYGMSSREWMALSDRERQAAMRTAAERETGIARAVDLANVEYGDPFITALDDQAPLGTRAKAAAQAAANLAWGPQMWGAGGAGALATELTGDKLIGEIAKQGVFAVMPGGMVHNLASLAKTAQGAATVAKLILGTGAAVGGGIALYNAQGQPWPEQAKLGILGVLTGGNLAGLATPASGIVGRRMFGDAQGVPRGMAVAPERDPLAAAESPAFGRTPEGTYRPSSQIEAPTLAGPPVQRTLPTGAVAALSDQALGIVRGRRGAVLTPEQAAQRARNDAANKRLFEAQQRLSPNDPEYDRLYYFQGSGEEGEAAWKAGAAAPPPNRNRYGIVASPSQEPAPTFYSQLQRAVSDPKAPTIGTADQWQGFLRGKYKPDEGAWTGLDDYLLQAKREGRKVTRQELLDHLAQNEVRVEEVVKGGAPPPLTWQEAGPGTWIADNGRDGHGPARITRMDGAYDGWFRVEPGGGARMREGQPTLFRSLEDAQAAAQEAHAAYAASALSPTRYGQFALPGGENYRELLLTLPEKPVAEPDIAGLQREYEAFLRSQNGEWTPEIERRAADFQRRFDEARRPALEAATRQYQSPHWDEPNVLAHVRFNDRVTPDGKRVLHVEEIQSDLHQTGRQKGYRQQLQRELEDMNRRAHEAPTWTGEDQLAYQKRAGEIKDALANGAPPDMPFAKTWPELAMKRVIRWAAENGYDRVTWTPGAAQAERYDLSKQLSSVAYSGSNFKAFGKDGEEVISRTGVRPEDLPDLIGKELADRLLAQQPRGTLRTLEGLNLQVGGEGMKAFYDRMLPEVASKLGKRFGARVTQSRVVADTRPPFRAVEQDGRWVVTRAGTPPTPQDWSFPTREQAEEVARQHTLQDKQAPAWGIDITPAMRQSVVQEGQPLFVHGGDDTLPDLLEGVGRAAARRGVVGGLTGAAAGAAAPADTPEERARNIGLGALGGATIGAGGTLAGTKALEALIKRGAVDVSVLSDHPDLANRVRAIMLAVADQTPPGEVVRVPALISAIQRLGGESLDAVRPLLRGTLTPDEVRQLVQQTASPRAVGRAFQEVLTDAVTGLGRRGARATETRADIGAVTRPGGPISGTTAEELTQALAARMGAEAPPVRVLPREAIGAWASGGRNAKHPGITVTQGLLDLGLSRDELVDVLAHEVAHTDDALIGRSLLERGARAVDQAIEGIVEAGRRAPGRLGEAFRIPEVTPQAGQAGILPERPRPSDRSPAVIRAEMEEARRAFSAAQAAGNKLQADRAIQALGELQAELTDALTVKPVTLGPAPELPRARPPLPAPPPVPPPLPPPLPQEPASEIIGPLSSGGPLTTLYGPHGEVLSTTGAPAATSPASAILGPRGEPLPPPPSAPAANAPAAEVKTWYEQAFDWLQRYRYFNLLSGTANAAGDFVTNGMNVPRLWGRTLLGSMNERLMGVPLAERATTRNELRGMNAGLWSGATQGMTDGLAVLLEGRRPVATEQAGSLIPGKLGAIPELGTRLRIAADTFWGHVGSEMASHMLAFREADREGLRFGSAEYAARVQDLATRISARMANVTEQGGTAFKTDQGRVNIAALAKEANSIAKRMVFQQEGGTTAKALGGARGNGGFIGWLIPFFKTNANMGAEGVTMTPVGWAGLGVDLARAGKNGPYAGKVGSRFARTDTAAVLPASQRLAEQQMAVMVMAAAGGLTAGGLLTGPGPSDPATLKRLRETGWQPYSLHLGDTYVPITRVLGPMAYPVVMGATMMEHYQKSGKVDLGLLADVADHTATYWFSDAGLRGFYDVLHVLGTTNQNERGKAIEQFLSGQVSSLIPGAGLLRQIEQATDPKLRDPKTLWERIKTGIPGLAETVPAQRTETGQERRRPAGQSGIRSLLPFQSSEQTPVTLKYLGSKGVEQDAEIGKALDAAEKWQNKPKEYVRPTPDQMRLYLRFHGRENPRYAQQRSAELQRQRLLKVAGR